MNLGCRKAELSTAIGRLARVRLAQLPTPLQEAPRLSKMMGGPRVVIKRDDLTDLAMSGNKARMFEFELGEALRQGADTVVSASVVQSNLLRVLAAACAKLGLNAHFLVSRVRGDQDFQLQGNLLLDVLLGANVRFVDVPISDPGFLAAREALAAQLRAQGCTVYVPYADHIDLAVVGYANCALEIAEQVGSVDNLPSHIYVASSKVTQAGLLLGLKHLQARTTVVGFTPEHWREDPPKEIAVLANRAAQRLGLGTRVDAAEVCNTMAYIGRAYGEPTKGCLEAIRAVARTEGVLLDPNYTGKAMAGLFDHMREGRFGRGDNVMFLHTGGIPALFAYNLELGDLSLLLKAG